MIREIFVRVGKGGGNAVVSPQITEVEENSNYGGGGWWMW